MEESFREVVIYLPETVKSIDLLVAGQTSIGAANHAPVLSLKPFRLAT
jgi:hypothetical protein